MDRVNVRRLGFGGVALAVVLVLGIGGYALFSYTRPYLHGTSCAVSGTGKDSGVELDLEQAANAATIAAVAYRKRLPEQALVIAYATAIQESKIRNLPGGDRDSIGLFQQRPSQGWGTPEELHDPVQASSKFFDVLQKVKHYETLPVEDAAQRVQHSADGSAYALHISNAKVLAAGFTGRMPASVHCWYSPDRQVASQLGAVPPLMVRAFGPISVTKGPQTTSVMTGGDQQYGWSVAAWAVSYAQGYGIREIKYAGKRWISDDGFSGWTDDDKAPGDRITIR